MIVHGYFIAITFAGPLEDIWTLGLAALCSNSFLGTRQMLMNENYGWSLYWFNVFWIDVVSTLHACLGTPGKKYCIFYLFYSLHGNTVDSRYLEFKGTLWNLSRYPYLEISAEVRKTINRTTTLSVMCSLFPKATFYIFICILDNPKYAEWM